MRRYCFCFFIWILAIGPYNAHGQAREVPVIVIDPGHGGMDSGAVGMNGIREKDVVFGIAMEVLRLNREIFGDSLEVYCTRYTDTLVSLSDRTKLLKALKADVFISLHCNRSDKQNARGIEVYIKQGNERAAHLAGLLAKGLTQNLGLRDRGVKYGNFQVLRDTGMLPVYCWNLGFCRTGKKPGIIQSQQVSLPMRCWFWKH